MKIINTKFKNLKIIQQKKHGDRRGYLRETFSKKIIKWDDLIFDYSTFSKKNVLRGFHFQSKFMQAKFVSVLKGKILDYVIDLRKKSKTFGKSFSIVLSEKNCKSLYIPEGFAHAYYSFSNLNIIYYKLSNYYYPEYEDVLLICVTETKQDQDLQGFVDAITGLLVLEGRVLGDLVSS